MKALPLPARLPACLQASLQSVPVWQCALPGRAAAPRGAGGGLDCATAPPTPSDYAACHHFICIFLSAFLFRKENYYKEYVQTKYGIW